MARPRKGLSDQETKDRLLTAGEAEFGRNGFAPARLEDIARAVGISRPSLLYHFKTKDDLYRAVVERAFARLAESLFAAITGQGSFLEKLERTLQSYLDFVRSDPALSRVILRELLEEESRGYEILMSEVLPILVQVEAFVRTEGRDVVREQLPLRQVILQIVFSAMLRSAAGPHQKELWGGADQTLSLVKTLILKEGVSWTFSKSSPTSPKTKMSSRKPAARGA